jgi:SAM-dependent methyltransferase
MQTPPDEPPGARAYSEVNRHWWDQVVPIHEASRGYDREGFLSGKQPLCPVELAELGPLVAGKRLLHLQCHFGIDTLNWARLGAQVTGLDYSAPAIEAAQRLARDSGIAGRFVHGEVYEAPALLGETFDVVYTGIGALCWLPDIRRWAQVVARCLAPGGLLYVYEGHPMLWTLNDRRSDGVLEVEGSYFEIATPFLNEGDTTYVDGPKLERRQTYNWNHGLGEIATAIIEAGLRIDFIHEHREVPWCALPQMVAVGEGTLGADGRYQANRTWRLPEHQRDLVPLMYSLLATSLPGNPGTSR